MRTNIVIDDVLINEALQISGLHTRKAVVDEALRLFVCMRKQAALRELRGRVVWEGNLAEGRSARHLLNEKESTYATDNDG